MINNTELETTSSIIPDNECYNEDGTIDKYKYMKQFSDFTKHEKKMTKKKVFKFLDKNSEIKHFRLEILDTSFGCNFYFTGDDDYHTERQKERFFKELWDAINSCVIAIKAFDFNVKDNYDCLEIWGIDDEGNSKILFLHTYANGVIEIGDED